MLQRRPATDEEIESIIDQIVNVMGTARDRREYRTYLRKYRDGHPDFQTIPHETKSVADPQSLTGAFIQIDKSIAPLISALWHLGIGTLNSCEDNVPKNYVWIEFDDSSSVNAFLNIIQKSATEHLIKCMAGECDEYSQWLFDTLYDPLDFPELGLTVSVRFPRKHLEEVTNIMLTKCNNNALTIKK